MNQPYNDYNNPNNQQPNNNPDNCQENSWQNSSNQYNSYNNQNVNNQYNQANQNGGRYGYRPPYQNGYNNQGYNYGPNGYYNRPPYYQTPPYARGFYPNQPAWNASFAVEKREKRKELTKKANWIGGGTLFTVLFGTIVSIIFTGILQLIGANPDGIYESALTYVFYSPLAVFLPYFIAAKGSKNKFSEMITFDKHSPALGTGVVLMGFLGMVAGNIASNIFIMLFPSLSNISDMISTNAASNYTELIVEILYMAAIPAIFEELAFRGVVLKMLRPYGDVFAIVMSSLAFALIHGNFIQIPMTFCAGLFMGYAYVRTGNLWSSVIIHFINNSLAVLIPTIIERYPVLNAFWFDIAIYCCWTIIGGIGLFMVIKKSKNQGINAGLKKYAGCLSLGERTGAILISPTIIISLLYYLGTAMLLPFIVNSGTIG